METQHMKTLTAMPLRTAAVMIVAGVALTLLAQAASAQNTADPRVPDRSQTIKLSGPRVGLTFLTEETRDTLAAHDIEVGSAITQFGWQFERQFLGKPGGLAALNEWIVLIGGLDQGAFLPSVSWIVGVRGQGGAEIGVGPNVSLAGVGLVASAGVTYRSSTMNIPLNFAVVPSKAGARVSIITGFTLNK
ncbi:MAG: hypothetical protein P3A28_01800 [Gemmatimonadota bacterium]|nr:hypothetical protein [Gemmatimonadota bacterium]